jgi:general nucleoside transport system permease protein
LYAGIAGLLKAAVGAYEVITTIMLNWIAVWTGSWLVGHSGALQSQANGASVPISRPVSEHAHLHVFWGNPVLQGLDVGFFVALVCLGVYAIVLNRTTLGFELPTQPASPSTRLATLRSPCPGCSPQWAGRTSRSASCTRSTRT